LISKLNIEIRKKLIRCYVWSIALYVLRDLVTDKIGAEVFVETRKVVLEENEKEKMNREGN
jgi:hypothetical protein